MDFAFEIYNQDLNVYAVTTKMDEFFKIVFENDQELNIKLFEQNFSELCAFFRDTIRESFVILPNTAAFFEKFFKIFIFF